ncbi:MAG: peptide/nickel transport system substrate-binding protein, partial [Frankiaceae bacterium]|nr:peptide/nickel transport system substrate-binding protein [Frankiaceae bacterium]
MSVTNFRTRPYALLVAVAVASSFLITACTSGSTSGSNAAAAGGTGGTLIVGMESEADILDPPRTGSWVTTRVFQQIFEGLVGEDLTKPS